MSDLIKREDVMETVQRVCGKYNMYFDTDYKNKRTGSFGVDLPKAIMEIPAASEHFTACNSKQVI